MLLELTQREWFFACPAFVEPLLAEELSGHGATQVKIGHAGVFAWGGLDFAYRAILWSRLASRATLLLAQGFGKNQSELCDLLQTIPWEQHLRADGSLRVRFSGQTEDIHHTQFGAQWVKDWIVDYFRERSGIRPNVSHNPDLVISVNIYSGKASIGIELNQKGLHQRGYRDPDAYYPLHENLAAAVLVRAGWPALLASDAEHLALLDPQCGAGAFLIEGALMAYDIAPGLLRGATLAQRWLGHDAVLWEHLLQEARERRAAGLAQVGRFSFWGAEHDPVQLAQAQADWATVGLPAVQWHQGERVPAIHPTLAAGVQGLVISRLAFDASLPSTAPLRPVYQGLGQWLERLPSGLRGALFADAAAPFALTDLFYAKDYRFLNGKEESRLWTLETLTRKAHPTVWISEDFANRLRKNLRKLKSFIQQGSSTAYRIYDADIPEYALAVDRYGDWLHVQEYAAPTSIDEKLAQQRLDQAIMTLPEVLGIAPERIIVKQRKRQKGSQQYERQAERAQAVIVTEHGVRCKVNLTEYLDTGLFLDHRPMRWWMQQHAKGKKVLNLFCYTGMASVHAAVGGALRVDSVDLSATYLDWAEDNFRINNLRPQAQQYRFIRANAVEWLERCPLRYDLIFLDPPTFSNSKKMQDVFDVQRDHVHLIRHALRCLEPDGTLIFSNNFRKFRLDEQIIEAFDVQDYRLQSLPADFQRDPKIHGCWLIRHR